MSFSVKSINTGMRSFLAHEPQHSQNYRLNHQNYLKKNNSKDHLMSHANILNSDLAIQEATLRRRSTNLTPNNNDSQQQNYIISNNQKDFPLQIIANNTIHLNKKISNNNKTNQSLNIDSPTTNTPTKLQLTPKKLNHYQYVVGKINNEYSEMEATTSTQQQYQQKSPIAPHPNIQNLVISSQNGSSIMQNRQTTINGYIQNGRVNPSPTPPLRTFTESYCSEETGPRHYASSSRNTSIINEMELEEHETTLIESKIENSSHIYTQPHNNNTESSLQINNITAPRFAAISRNYNKKAQEVAALHAAIKNSDQITTSIENDDEETIKLSEQIIQRNGGGNDADADAEVTETLLNTMEAIPSNASPIKFQILNYVANTTQLHIRRTGSELQITDASGFPLLDVWLKTSCFRQQSTWILESYGRTVLLLANLKKKSWHCWQSNNYLQQTNNISTNKVPLDSTNNHCFNNNNNNKSESDAQILQVLNSENETLGFFIVGDPFIVQNHERKTIARFSSNNSSYSDNLNNSVKNTSSGIRIYQCALETNGQEICRLELHSSQTRLMQLKFNAYTPLTFPLKLLLLASAVRLAALLSSSTNKKISKRSKSIPKNFVSNSQNGVQSLTNGRTSPINLIEQTMDSDTQHMQIGTNTHYVPASKSYCTIA